MRYLTYTLALFSSLICDEVRWSTGLAEHWSFHWSSYWKLMLGLKKLNGIPPLHSCGNDRQITANYKSMCDNAEQKSSESIHHHCFLYFWWAAKSNWCIELTCFVNFCMNNTCCSELFSKNDLVSVHSYLINQKSIHICRHFSPWTAATPVPFRIRQSWSTNRFPSEL